MRFDPAPHVAINAPRAQADQILAALDRTEALLPGHFALQRGRHAPFALRFRAIARDGAALQLVASALLEQARWRWDDVMLVGPDTAGFFLGDALSRATGRPHAVVRTDLRRLPTDQLVAGSIPEGAPAVIVNDIASTGDTLEPILHLLAGRRAPLCGVLVFAVVGVEDFQAFCNRAGAQPGWLVTARWRPVDPGPETCEGCRLRQPSIPIAELS